MTSFQVLVPVGLGTGVARTSLGTVNKPSETQNLIEFTPYWAPSGATTTVESMLLASEVVSASVTDILPKRVINAPMQSGLGATYGVTIPILNAFEANTPMKSGSNDILEGFGQSQVANAVAPAMGVEFHFSDSPPTASQMYYEKPDNETSTGTAATTVAGGSLTINGGRMLQHLYGEVANVTGLASESILGSFQFNSANFDSSQTLEIAGQPVGMGLGATLSEGQPKANIRKNVAMGMKSTCTINTIYRQSEAVTTAMNFIHAIGYTKV